MKALASSDLFCSLLKNSTLSVGILPVHALICLTAPVLEMCSSALVGLNPDQLLLHQRHFQPALPFTMASVSIMSTSQTLNCASNFAESSSSSAAAVLAAGAAAELDLLGVDLLGAGAGAEL